MELARERMGINGLFDYFFSNGLYIGLEIFLKVYLLLKPFGFYCQCCQPLRQIVMQWLPGQRAAPLRQFRDDFRGLFQRPGERRVAAYKAQAAVS